MKLSNSTSAFVLALFATSSSVMANIDTSEVSPPDNCIGTKLSPIIDHDTLQTNDAICRDDTRLGINADGIYGVWNGDDELVQKFANGVYKLKLTENNDGEQIDVVAYKNKGELDPIWHLSCQGLSGQGETKLTVHDENSIIVRLKQGHKAQDMLWLVNRNGRAKLDDTEGRVCRIEEKHETRESGATNTDQYKMIVFSPNKKVCMSTNRSEGLREGDRVALATCSNEDDSELFVFDERGRIRPRRSPDLCVNVDEAAEGEELVLTDCRVANNNVWLYDRTRNHELRPRGGEDYCANYGNGLVGASIALQECTRLAAWDFVNPFEYVAPLDTEEDEYQSSRKFLRWRKLVDGLIDK